MFHYNTPLIESKELGLRISSDGKKHVLLKMDCLQPSGSFKIRGIGYACYKAIKERKCRKLVSSSGGNAGLAVAYAGRELGVPVTVVVPETTSPYMRKKISDLEAQVILYGNVWDEANEKALTIATEPDVAYIHPFDDSEVWEGHASIIREISDHYKNHVEQKTFKPDLIITVVGGGGLLCGIIRGLDEVGWNKVPIIAAETEGAASFFESVKQGKVITLPEIKTIARTLGAKRICDKAFEYTKNHNIIPSTVTDKQALNAILNFANELRVLVEPSCGAGLAFLYDRVDFIQELLKDRETATIIVIVCGGSGVTLDILEQWKKQFGL